MRCVWPLVQVGVRPEGKRYASRDSPPVESAGGTECTVKFLELVGPADFPERHVQLPL